MLSVASRQWAILTVDTLGGGGGGETAEANLVKYPLSRLDKSCFFVGALQWRCRSRLCVVLELSGRSWQAPGVLGQRNV